MKLYRTNDNDGIFLINFWNFGFRFYTSTFPPRRFEDIMVIAQRSGRKRGGYFHDGGKEAISREVDASAPLG